MKLMVKNRRRTTCVAWRFKVWEYPFVLTKLSESFLRGK